MQDRDFQARLQRLEGLLREIEHGPDPAARERTRQMVQALLELHAAGLKAIVDRLAAVPDVLDELARDDLVGSVLLLHDLHPLDTAARVRLALDSVRPLLHSHGGNVELISVDGATVRLRLLGSCDGCPSSAATMRQTIEEAVYGRAPEIAAIEVEGLAEAMPGPVPDDGARFALPLV